MTEALISGFIDDELVLDEKIAFVETVHADAAYKTETVTLLNQEKTLRLEPVELVPPVVLSADARRGAFQWLRMLMVGLGSVAAVIILWMSLAPQNEVTEVALSARHRFILYRPNAERAEISGSFTNWHPVGMQRIGSSGYWELRLDLSGGEHRFAYILDGNERITDPTVLAREKDDFGGENSILKVSL